MADPVKEAQQRKPVQPGSPTPTVGGLFNALFGGNFLPARTPATSRMNPPATPSPAASESFDVPVPNGYAFPEPPPENPLTGVLAEGGYVAIPGRPGVYLNSNGDILDLNAKGAGGGAPSRFLFPEEQEAMRLENEKNRRILAGELGFQEIRPGFFFDPITKQSYNQNELDLAAKKIAEDARQFGLTFEEGVRRARAQERQNATAETRLGRQLDLEGELGRGRLANDQSRLALDAELGRGRQALDETKIISDILSRPAQFVTQAFLSRGNQTGALTQADLLNNMRMAVRGGAQQQNPRIAQQPVQIDVAALQETPDLGYAALPRPMAGSRFNGVAIDPNFAGVNSRGRYFADVNGNPVYADELDTAMNSQQEITRLARENSPQAVTAVVGTGDPGLSSPLRTSRLTAGDTEALGARLAAEGTSLERYGEAQNQLFGQKRSTRRSRLVI